ncbi:methylenetetrahydrofolate reduct [Dendrothele bispora CBS 962.96]|uniref:Methylenetetrahydrofolate reduct n=1 Tax=Dendrothele bispora (strain CBS 962.96) TaxID=1314807 RepID=A0A4S8LHT6_DENBC|nr:methylenetetrahydrofolate reduct [Dendrothele bispora CBS 962.96]
MKLTDKIAAHSSPFPFFTFEFFPPRTDQGFENLVPRIGRLSSLKPLAISVTWGAGGSTKERSLDLAGLTQSNFGTDVILHLTCTNMVQGMVDEALLAAKERGIQNILALRGDPPRGKEEWIPIDPKFQHGIDLVSYIHSKPELSSHFCVGVAGYPEGHPDNLISEETEMEYLQQKVDAGAGFIVTQIFYNVDRFLTWIKKVRERGIKVPIIPGIMPIQTYSSFLRLVKLCGIDVPPSVRLALEDIKLDDQSVKNYGVQLAVDMIRQITAAGVVPGVHLCTLNLEKSVQRVLEQLQWTGVSHSFQNKLISEETSNKAEPATDGRFVSPSAAANAATLGLANIPPSGTEVGSGELNKADSWDDFPNGRFGDFKSPAYGDQGPWGNSGTVRPETLSEWGNPQSLSDLTTLFLNHLHSKINKTPFSPGPLSAESLLILPHLEKLTKRGWWTVGSQPAVDGKESSDEVVGWGPKTGFIFQKGFVEFFCTEEDLNQIEKQVEQKGEEWVHWFAANSRGECRGNVPEDGRNAVTWGVFPGQEIIQTTIIEQENFLSWAEEAFSIWKNWASFYRPGSPERALLESVHHERWLVSIVHHNYKDASALWTFLSEA